MCEFVSKYCLRVCVCGVVVVVCIVSTNEHKTGLWIWFGGIDNFVLL